MKEKENIPTPCINYASNIWNVGKLYEATTPQQKRKISCLPADGEQEEACFKVENYETNYVCSSTRTCC